MSGIEGLLQPQQEAYHHDCLKATNDNDTITLFFKWKVQE